MSKISHLRVVRTLPVVLSREEASRLIESARSLKHGTVLSAASGAGLRVGEVIALKVGDVDSQRMLLRIAKGKGQKDRYALLCSRDCALRASRGQSSARGGQWIRKTTLPRVWPVSSRW